MNSKNNIKKKSLRFSCVLFAISGFIVLTVDTFLNDSNSILLYFYNVFETITRYKYL